MEKNYYELIISSKNALEIFKNFAFELGVEAIEENSENFIIRDSESLENLEFALKQFRKSLSENLGLEIDLKTEISVKENCDWIENYKKSVRPIEVGKFFIRPSWEAPKNGLIDIIIDPALAFGSGHHESTNMCLSLISKYAKNGDFALDVGCGSGILSIAFAKLGAKINACDTDEQAVFSSLQNARKNGIKFEKIWTGSVNGGKIFSTAENFKNEQKFSIITANIIADVIFMLKNDLKNSLQNGGILILSGILEIYKERILENFSDLENLEISQKNEWLSFVFKKEKNG